MKTIAILVLVVLAVVFLNMYLKKRFPKYGAVVGRMAGWVGRQFKKVFP